MSCIWDSEVNGFDGVNGPPGGIPCNNVVGSVNHFTGRVFYSQFGYNHIEWAVYLFLALNAFCLAAHLGLGIYWRTWWTIPTLAAGALIEVMGWSGRVWALKSTVWNPNNGGFWYSNYGGFIMQIVCLVIAPTFFSAANYVLLNRLVRATGGVYSMITPHSFTVVFIVADVLCIVVQGIGGGMAGTSDTLRQANNGAYVMTGGVCLQLFVTLLFCVLYVEFIYRFLKSRPAPKQYDILTPFRRLRFRRNKRAPPSPNPSAVEKQDGSSTESAAAAQSAVATESRSKIMMITFVLGFTTLLINIRGVYRAIELTDGWRGPIATDQPLFLGMDALLMVLLLLSYIAYHPGVALKGK